MSSPKPQSQQGIKCIIDLHAVARSPRLVANGTEWYISVPVQWLETQLGAVDLIFHKTYRAFYDVAEAFDIGGFKGDRKSRVSMKIIQECRDCIECLTNAFPDHPHFPALLESAIELEAKATLLNAATGGR